MPVNYRECAPPTPQTSLTPKIKLACPGEDGARECCVVDSEITNRRLHDGRLGLRAGAIVDSTVVYQWITWGNRSLYSLPV